MNSLDRAYRGAKGDWQLHLLSVFSVGVAFVCLVATLLVVVNVERVHDRWRHVSRISVYLRSGAEPAAIADLEKALRASSGIGQVRFVSSEAARRELLNDDSTDALAALPEQAFPASLEVETAERLLPERRQRIAAQLKSLPAVESVETYESWGERLGTALVGGVTAAAILALVVLAAVISVVSSTMRLSLQRRRLEVEVLKLVGATDAYVRQPFVLEGASQGACGATLALLLVGLLYGIVRTQLDGHLSGLLGIAPEFLPWFAVLGLIGLGGVLGAAAAQLSLRKLLAV